jgi:hypothetical protein
LLTVTREAVRQQTKVFIIISSSNLLIDLR